jgi:hypothetical protein
MASTTIIAEERVITPHESAHLPGHFLSWGAIIAGAVCGAAISLLLFAFGSAIGLTAVSPWPHIGLSPVVLAVIAALWVAIVQVVGFGAAGYVAGRVRNSWRSVTPHEQRFRDGMHGFITWALALLMGSAFAVSAAGGLLRGGAQAAAPIAAAGMAARQTPAAVTPGDYGVDYLLRPGPAAAGTPAPNSTLNMTDLRPALVRIFADNLGAASLPPRERAYLASLVSTQTGLAQADAEKRVDEAFAEAKSAEAKARLAADKARKATALAAFLAAATLAVGCAAACAAAGVGGRHRDEQIELRLFGTKRFW